MNPVVMNPENNGLISPQNSDKTNTIGPNQHELWDQHSTESCGKSSPSAHIGHPLQSSGSNLMS